MGGGGRMALLSDDEDFVQELQVPASMMGAARSDEEAKYNMQRRQRKVILTMFISIVIRAFTTHNKESNIKIVKYGIIVTILCNE